MPTEEESYIRWGVIDHKLQPIGEETTPRATDLEKFLMGLMFQQRETIDKQVKAEKQDDASEESPA